MKAREGESSKFPALLRLLPATPSLTLTCSTDWGEGEQKQKTKDLTWFISPVITTN